MTPETGRDVGIARATSAANRKDPKWSDDAYAALRLFIDDTRSEFMAEEVRAFAETSLGLTRAPDARAWGGVMQKANRAGLVSLVAYRPSGNPQAHTRPTAVWKPA